MNENKSKKLNRKELQILKAYKEYFPNLKKACEMSKIKMVDVLIMMDENYRFKAEMEAVRVGIFSLAEKTLVDILEDSETSIHHKISTAKAILQYKQVLSKF
jgi:hypothetical protein